MCWAGTSQPGWEDADAVKASGGPELCWLGSGPVYGTWAAGETEAGVGVRKLFGSQLQGAVFVHVTWRVGFPLA